MTRGLAILAAGASARLGQDKVLADLGGRPVLLWSLAAAAACGMFDEVVVVAPAADGRRVAEVVGAVAARVRIVPGGETRTASSWAALDALAGCDVIAIHDAARPFVVPSLFERCVAAAESDGAAAAGLVVADTVRRVDEAGVSHDEVARDGLWVMQTPQAFRRELLERARAAAGEASFTDDAAAVAAIGERVRMVHGDRRNFKITTAEDLEYARELAAKGFAAVSAQVAR